MCHVTCRLYSNITITSMAACFSVCEDRGVFVYLSICTNCVVIFYAFLICFFSTQCQYTQRDPENLGKKQTKTTRIFMGYCLQIGVNMSGIRGKKYVANSTYFFLVPFKWVCKEYILRYAMKKNVEPQTTDLFPHFSIYEEKRMKKKSFQNVQCRFASLFKILHFQLCVCARYQITPTFK